MSDNPIQYIPGDSAFTYAGQRYEVIVPEGGSLEQIAQAFVHNANKHAQVYRLDEAKARFEYQGQWFKISYLSGTSVRESLAQKPDAHKLIEEVVISFIEGVNAKQVDLSQFAKATLQLGGQGAQGEMKYFKPEGLTSKTPNWTHTTGSAHFKQITERLHNKVDYLDVEKSYSRRDSPPEIEGVCGYRNAGNTCFAGAALTEMRAMYVDEDDAPEIYKKQATGQPIASPEVVHCIRDNWKPYTGRQEDPAEFRDELIKKRNTLRLPVNIFKNYLKIDVSQQRRAELLGLFAPKKGVEPQDLANVRASLLKIFQSERPSNEDILDFIEKNRQINCEENEFNAYVQQAQLAFPEANIPDDRRNWDTADHLSFALYKLGLYIPGETSQQPIPFPPYGDLGNSHIHYTLTPTQYKRDNTLQELVDNSNIVSTLALNKQINPNQPLPEFIPLDLLRRNDNGQKTYHPVALGDNNIVKFSENVHYEVCGFTRHVGPNAQSGHYIGYTRLDDGSWVECNDDKLRKLTQEQVQKISKETIRTLLLRRVRTN
ncbi:MAG: ubiquitin carboxyl-terminal hydrolase [Verrucomicrobia bacterium]|nr:ubiquitin carboxyl-terminal hydrolase [Verrucomicrobiota bacterium]